MNFLFLFLDGVGLGSNNPGRNPFSSVPMPNLIQLLDNHRLTADSLDGLHNIEAQNFPQPSAQLVTSRATLLALDPNLGVQGIPQSATGQATLLTGINVPAAIGYHYGPKPNPEIAEYVSNGNLFHQLKQKGWHTALLGAYPPVYFSAIQSGRRKYSAIPLAAVSAGLSLKNIQDLSAGEALAADFTGNGWREHLGLTDIPLYTPFQAGEKLAELSFKYHFTFFEYWMSDYVGHHQDMTAAHMILTSFDEVLAGLLASWNDQTGLVLITSDHGNLEDLSTRRHTRNPVPALLIGSAQRRAKFTRSLIDLSDVASAIMDSFT